MSGSTHAAGGGTARASQGRRWLSAAGLVALSVGCILLVWPRFLGAERAVAVAQVISFRPAIVIGFGVLAAVAVVLVVFLALRRRRIAWAGAAAVVILLATTVGNALVLADRGWAEGDVSARGSADSITVLSWNTQGGATTAAEVAELAARTRADIVALPETDDVAAAEIAHLLTERGVRMNAQTTGEWIPTSLLVSERLGSYRHEVAAGSTPGLPSGVWVPQGGGSGSRGSMPTIVVAHPMPPLPSSMQAWRDGLDWVARQCRIRGPEVVIAGDFNATLDHLPATPGCSDAARATGAAGWGSWPATAPSWFAAPIDHILVGEAWRTVAFQVVNSDQEGSDHRAIVAVLER